MAEPKVRASNQLNIDANIDWNAKKITNLAAPTASGDAATKDYVDSTAVGLLDDRGNYDASGNGFPTTGGSGTAGAILKGDVWYISVAGTLGTKVCDIGFSIRALVDTPGQTAGNWSILSSGFSFTPENSANKVTAFSTPTDVQYPSAKLVYDQLAGKTGAETITTIGALINGATAKDAPVDADMVGLMDSADSNKLKKLSWAYIKSVLKTYFDGIYMATGSALQASGYVCREVPSGTKNGSNTTFTLANTPTSGTEMLFRNGLLLIAGSGNSYTISGGTITMAIAPQSDDALYCTYWK